MSEKSLVKLSSASPATSQQVHFFKQGDCTALGIILRSVAWSTTPIQKIAFFVNES